MKKAFFLLVGLAGSASVMAQQKAGTITYERKINMHKQITDPQMQAMMPEFRTSQHILLFSDSVSVYRLVPEDEAPDPFAGGNGGGVRMIFRGPGSDGGDLFNNFAQAKSVQSTELGGKNFLIVDTIKQQPWKLSEETKQFLGFTCHKATRKITQSVGGRRMITMSAGGAKIDTSLNKPQTKEVEVVAWYADNIITPAGPDNYGQLPGAILQLDIDNATTVYTAKEVKTNVNAKELKEPSKGKTVTRAEYMKLMSDMMGNMGSGGATMRFGG